MKTETKRVAQGILASMLICSAFGAQAITSLTAAGWDASELEAARIAVAPSAPHGQQELSIRDTQSVPVMTGTKNANSSAMKRIQNTRKVVMHLPDQPSTDINGRF